MEKVEPMTSKCCNAPTQELPVFSGVYYCNDCGDECEVWQEQSIEKKYKRIKKRLKLTDDDVGRLFGMGEGKTSAAVQFANSSARDRYIAAFVGMFEMIGQKQIELFNLDR